MGVVQVTDNDFEQEVLQAKQLVLADFWAPWCGPCQAMGPILDKLAQDFDSKVKVCKINVDENQTSASKYQILSIPTLLFFKEGQIATQLVGARSELDIKNTISSLL
ncbi:MAG: thioredoxin [Candidatus Omnitrophica bacterium]|nr:thioredoxin [Candidatus Omnitrophota bacterium]